MEGSSGEHATADARREKERRAPSIRTVWMAIILIVVGATSAAFMALLVATRTRDATARADAQLLTAAEMAREVLGPDYHDRIDDASSISPAEFRQTVERHRSLCRRLNLQYLWSVLEVDGRLVFTSATPSDIEDPDSPFAAFFETHSDPESFAPAMGPSMAPVYSTFHNEWGRGRMALVPYQDSQGRRYIFGASVQWTHYNAMIRQAVVAALGVSALVMVGAMLMALALAQWFTTPIIRLTQAADRMATGDLDAPLAPVGARELQSLSHSIDVMRQSLQRNLADQKRERLLLRTVINNLPDAVYAKDAQGRKTLANPVDLEHIGLSEAEVLGKTDSEVFPPEIAAPYEADDQQVLQTGQPVIDHQEMAFSRDGRKRWLLTTKLPLRDDDGQIVGLIGIGRNITDHKESEAALRESEAKYRRLIENAAEAIFVAQDGRLLFVNPRTEKISGYPAEALIRQPFLDFVHPDDRQMVAANARKRLEGELAESSYTFRILHPAQGIRWVELNAVRIDWEGRPATLNFLTDITERRQAEAALRESEATNRAMLNALPDIMFLFNRDGVYLDYHAYDESMLAAPPEAFLGKSFRDVLPGSLSDQFDESIARAYQTRQMQMMEYTLEIPGGTKYFEARLNPIDDQRALAIVRDITDSKRAAEALRQSEALLSASQKMAHLGSWELNLETNQLTWSDEIYRIFGLEPQGFEATYEAFLDLIHPDDRDRVASAYSESIADGSDGYTIEHRIVRPSSGDIRHVQEMCEHFRDGSGQIVRSIGMTQDITERKRAEEEWDKMQAQLTQAQKMESVGRLAGGVAHDFNNMLGVILGHAEMALEQLGPLNKASDGLKEIQKAAERSADLTRQLLAFARKQTVSPKVLNLNETVEGMLKMLRRLIGEHIDLVWHPGADLWPVRMDPSQIDQILANLCVNARDAIGAVGKVTIETATRVFDGAYCADNMGFLAGDYLMLTVSDDGYGMDKETVAHVFEPFFTTKAVGKGTGLGLATVYGIVRQNHGFINVYSEPDQGTTFNIYLPRHVGKGEAGQTDSAERPVQRGHETILLVEDERAILAMATRMLERQGYKVLAAATPGEAMRIAERHKGDIQLLMTDVVMPEMNGRDLARNLLALYPNLKRLFMSGYTADVIAHHGVLDPGVHFIHKPFSMKELAARLREALEDE